MVMAVAGICRRLELRGLSARRILDLLRRSRRCAGAENARPRHYQKSPQHVAPIPSGLLHRLLLAALRRHSPDSDGLRPGWLSRASVATAIARRLRGHASALERAYITGLNESQRVFCWHSQRPEGTRAASIQVLSAEWIQARSTRTRCYPLCYPRVAATSLTNS